jgi:hypothetical protein
LHETAQAERVLTKWALPSSGGIPTPTDDVRSLQENIVTAAVTGGSHVRSLSLISDITAAVDEWFDHFGRHDTFHSAGQGKTKTLMNWDLHDLTDQVPDGPDHERILSPLNKG